jgi:hypothetical protein
MIDRTELLKHVIQLRRKVEGVISSLEADLRKALTRLTMFELLAKDSRFGKWYISYVGFERLLTERLQEYITESESRIAQIDRFLSDVLHMQATA